MPAAATSRDALTWWCLLRPGKTLLGEYFGVEGEYNAEVLQASANGNYRVRFQPLRDESVTDLCERLGIMPLPPTSSAPPMTRAAAPTAIATRPCTRTTKNVWRSPRRLPVYTLPPS